jgi:hypothetical protein
MEDPSVIGTGWKYTADTLSQLAFSSSKIGVSSKPAAWPGAAALAEEALLALEDADALLALAEAEALLALADADELEAELEQAAKPKLATMTADTAKHAISFFAFLVCSIPFSYL